MQLTTPHIQWEQFNFSNLKDAAGFARRGSNSAVLKQIRYYCHNYRMATSLLIHQGLMLQFRKMQNGRIIRLKTPIPQLSSAFSSLPISAGDMTKEETELLEKMRT